MPIQLIWGDDDVACEKAIASLIQQIIEPAWSNINLTRLDGSDLSQASQALDEVRTPPLGGGGRIILVRKSPFCNACPSELASRFEDILELIPKETHLILNNPNKPDGRLRTTKALQKLIKSNLVIEQRFVLPTVWDEAGQQELVERSAKALGLELEPAAKLKLVEAIGNDSSRLNSELQKLSLYAENSMHQEQSINNNLFISVKTVNALITGVTTNALEVGNYLLKGNPTEAISLLDALLESGEPALRILATLTGQVRGWLWVSLLELEGEKDVAVIAKAAGIGNPKRIYVMRKQLKGKQPKNFLGLLNSLLQIEAAIKRGSLPKAAFRDGLLTDNSFC